MVFRQVTHWHLLSQLRKRCRASRRSRGAANQMWSPNPVDRSPAPCNPIYMTECDGQLTDQTRAERSAAVMLANDAASRWLGMELVSVGPGQAEMRMIVQQHHLNGHATCHGGVIFALADSAFAVACNSRNAVAVAQTNSITYIAPGKVGDNLSARAREVSRSGRSGVYDVTVASEDGRVIAEFRGLSRTIKGHHFEEPE